MSSSLPISVVISIHNAMPDLRVATESILKQSFHLFEFIIVNDHSSDSSLDYLRSLSDSRIRLTENPAKGQTSALNHGLRVATGDWIARMDGDDWSHPERLEKQFAMAQKSPQAALISADYWLCNDALQVVSEMRLNPNHTAFMNYLNTRQNPFCHPVMMFNRHKVLSLGGYDDSLQTAQDYDLWRRLLARYPLAHVAEPLLKYRVRRDAVSIARFAEQTQSRQTILSKTASAPPPESTNPNGLYAYRLGFAAWVGGKRSACFHYMLTALRTRTRVWQALAAILTCWMPRRLYLVLTGYAHVYR